jgi:hypothetical protein
LARVERYGSADKKADLLSAFPDLEKEHSFSDNGSYLFNWSAVEHFWNYYPKTNQLFSVVDWI